MIGIDEVGRGCWAGPLLVVAAREVKKLPEGIADSKVLSKSKRESLYPLIKESCEFGEGWVTAREIDKFGLSSALKLGAERALNALSARKDEKIILDGSFNYCPKEYINVETKIKADATIKIVGAASIFAKVRRDAYMNMMDEKYPGYGFKSHVGYGTKVHSVALSKLGPCKLHRMSFKPVRLNVAI